MDGRRRIIVLDVRLDGKRVSGETTAVRAGPDVLSVITVLPDHGVLFQLASTFIGHRGVDTHPCWLKAEEHERTKRKIYLSTFLLLCHQWR